MAVSRNAPDYCGNACAFFSDKDKAKLWQAACTLVDERGLIVRITAFVGQGAEWVGDKASEFGTKIFGEGWEEKVRRYAEEALWRGHDLATLGMDSTGDQKPRVWFNKIVSSATGAVGGFFGLPGIAIDIPVSTLLIMRSIAEIARSHGEDITLEDSKRACLEVMAFGGPGTEDDDLEIGYWSTRACFAHATVEVAIRQAATRFTVVLSEKALAQVVPIAGALAGGGLNYVFMDYYQQMARVHFTIRALERAYGTENSVRACFEQLIRQAKERQHFWKQDNKSSKIAA